MEPTIFFGFVAGLFQMLIWWLLHLFLSSLLLVFLFLLLPQIIVFNRVRSMTSDMSLLVAAMRRSTELELRDEVRA